MVKLCQVLKGLNHKSQDEVSGVGRIPSFLYHLATSPAIVTLSNSGAWRGSCCDSWWLPQRL